MPEATVLAGRYRLQTILGSGAMSTVWHAQDDVLKRQVAVKVVHLAQSDPTVGARFTRETEATAALSHPNIVIIFDAGVSGDDAFLVMELLPGPTLTELIAESGQLSLSDAVQYAVQAASALSAAHGAGVIHRDIKPANLMLAADGQLRVLDFGIAALLDVNTAALTQAHMVLGTVAYMAPEQARGERADASADIYSLGCVLMAMTTGQPPFTADHPMGLITAHMSSPAPRLAERRPDAPADLDHLVAEMLAKDPRDRPSSADAVEHTLETILSRLQPDLVVPTAAMLATTVEILGASQPAEPAQRTVSMPPSPPLSDGALDPTVVMPSRSDKPRRRRTWILLAVSALVLTLLGLWILTRGSESAPAATATQSPGPSPSVSVAATTIPDGIARLRAAVGAAAESGNLDESGAGELDALIDNFPTSASGASQMSWVPSSAPLVTTAKGDKGSKVKPDKKPGPGKPTAPKSDPAQTVSQQLDYFSARVTGLADEGRLTMAGEAPVRVALDELRVLYRA